MITKENCKKLENGKVIMDFAVFQELANAKIESLKASISNNELQIEINNLKMEISEYKWLIKQLVTEIVKASDMENSQFYKFRYILKSLRKERWRGNVLLNQ